MLADNTQFMYLRFTVLGIATLVAWNVFIVSSDFFRWEFRNTPFKDSFESVFSVLSNSVNLGALCYALYTQAKANHDRRIRNGLVATIVALGSTFLLPALALEGWTALIIALSALCVAAVAAAYVQCSIFGIAALLPEHCAEGFMSGQAIAGTVASAAQLVAICASRSDRGNDAVRAVYDRNSNIRICAAVYFFVAAAFLAFSTAAWKQLRTRLALAGAAHSDQLSDNMIISRMQEESPRLSRMQSTISVSNAETGLASAGSGSRLDLNRTQLETITSNVNAANANSRSAWVDKWLTYFELQNAQMLYDTATEIMPFVTISTLVMAQTLAVFPPLTEAIVSSPQGSIQVTHLTAWHFLVFNIGDYAGRVSTQWVECTSLRVLRVTVHSRWLLVMVFLLFPTSATSPQQSWTIQSDILFLLLIFILGWSNGLIATVALILGPKLATNKELAGSIIGFTMCIGLVIGAIASYPILRISGIS
ncbi:hypothetical protein IWW36_000004 [Coemansia brasiliensis]|uniref:Uncharacterized protein n=1 Tax=Coemansia brasiliensis TaxID=2650707 RepID=A0A9W8IBQ2_9FUNG|nr:hypothetical protein IWW36_000004 [Coemansia brasiliensis]